MALHNESVVKSAAKTQDLFGENLGLKHDLIHLQAENHALAQQVDIITGYYKGEIIKLKDEIMILKSDVGAGPPLYTPPTKNK